MKLYEVIASMGNIKSNTWIVRTYDKDYEIENFYRFETELDVINFISKKVVTSYFGNKVVLGEHEKICSIRYAIDYDINEN